MKFNLVYKKLCEMYINESVSFTVEGRRTAKTVLDVASRILYSSELDEFIKRNLNEEEIANWKASKMHEFITSDGDDFDRSEGIINFYIKGLPDHILPKMVSFIKYYIGENDAEMNGEVFRNKSGIYSSDVYRFPIKVKPSSNAPELNVSNRNARIILCDILNYKSDDVEDYQPLNARELLMKIETVEDNVFILSKHAMENEEDGNHISFGISLERIKQILGQLKALTEYAIENDYTYVNLS